MGNCRVWSTLTLSHPSCPTGIVLGYQLGEIRVSPLSLGPHLELPWASETLGSHDLTENTTWILLPLFKDVSLVPPSSSSCSELTVTITSKGPWACSRGCGMRSSLWELFNPQWHTQPICTHQPKSGRTQAQNPSDLREWKSKKENQAWSRSKRRNFHTTSPPDWLEKDAGQQQAIPKSETHTRVHSQSFC